MERGDRVEAKYAIDNLIARSIPCVGIRWDGDSLVVACPLDKHSEASQKLKELNPKFIDVSEAEISDLLDLVESETDESAKVNFAAITGDAPISHLVETLIDRAVAYRASDLHIEPFETIVKVRIRVDGRLIVLTELPIEIAPAIASRIKILSQLNIVERRRPQDGQFTANTRGRRVDIRVSFTATLYGEKIVMRLHDERRPLVDLSQLGMPDFQFQPFLRAVNAVNGLILAAGPTGSGKTTTLHSALRATNKPWKNITTIEDPVEYVVPGINQIPIIEASGITFAMQLRAILRQDPDVILVGETRDAETARISIQAALTGHLVLSSIHANDAIGAVYRLMQMDIEPYLVASSLTLVISQRLVRRVCRFCKSTYQPSHAEKLILDKYEINQNDFAIGLGCSFCGGSGYLDRIAAYQMLEISEKLSEMISNRPDPAEFRREAEAEGMSTVAKQALYLASIGETGINEAMELLNYAD